MYKNDIDNLKIRNTTLQTITSALLNYEEETAIELVREIRTCESLDAVAEKIVAKERGIDYDDDEDYDLSPNENSRSLAPTFETQLYGKMGDLRLDAGTVTYIGGTSNLIHISLDDGDDEADEYPQHDVSGVSALIEISNANADVYRTLILLGQESQMILNLFCTCLICTLPGTIHSSQRCQKVYSGEISVSASHPQTRSERRTIAHHCLSTPCWPLLVISHLTGELETTRTIQERLVITSFERPKSS